MGSDGTTTKQKKRKGSQSRGKNLYYIVTRVKEGDKKHDEYYYARKTVCRGSISFKVTIMENDGKLGHYIFGGNVSQPITFIHGQTYKAGKSGAFYKIISGPHDPSAAPPAVPATAPAAALAAPAAPVLDSSTFEPSSVSTSSRKLTQRSKGTRSTPPEAETSSMIENSDDALIMSSTDTSAANPLSLTNLSSLKRKSPPAPGLDDTDDKPQSRSKRRLRQLGVSFAPASRAPISLLSSSSRTLTPISHRPAVFEAFASTFDRTPLKPRQLGNTGSTKAVIRECKLKDISCIKPSSKSGGPWWRLNEAGSFTTIFKSDKFEEDTYCNTCKANICRQQNVLR